eukprot:TRINITY_DN1286_c4_g1_i1.p1 TRINITY_DN1286_c4_g1~~TRINITY_DN1286_c4_g1_i1.p1  ORF type:complete len:498 (+),score=94.18 TRINITY_DN1286_c4_g1_i1:135-1496(+)
MAVGFRTSYLPSLAISSKASQRCPSRTMALYVSDFNPLWNKLPRRIDAYSFATRSNLLKNRVLAVPEKSGSDSDPMDSDEEPCYQPFEEVTDSVQQGNEDAKLTDAEMTKTMIEVNSKATLMFSGVIHDEVHENIFWPDLPYVTDEHGDIYFEVSDDEDILQTLTTDNKFVQVIIGLDNVEMLTEVELSGPSDIDYGIEEVTDVDSDIDDEDDSDWVAILDEEEDDMDSFETLGDWANLETMRSSHPLYFAKKLAEAVSNLHLDLMDQPSSGLSIQGRLRPSLIDELSIIRKHISGNQTSNDERDQELEKDESLPAGTSFYKLEMVDIQLVSAYGHQSMVKVKDFRQARPDVIAHSAANIISRLKAGGEKTVKALKSLCWREKGIQVEEAIVIGVDSLGLDLRVCSGTQVQTLRFAFHARATSEYSAERRLHDLLFPRIQKLQQRQQAHQKEA